MKKTFIAILVFATLLGCKNNENFNKTTESIFIQPEKILIADTINKLLKDYVNYLNDPAGVVYQVFIDQNPDSSTIYIGFIQFSAQLEKYRPSGYIKINKNLFLVYSGVENLLINDSIFTRKLDMELSMIKLKENTHSPEFFEKLAWSITFYPEKKNFIINWNSRFPYNALEYVAE